MSDQDEILKQTVIEDESPEAALAAKLKESKKLKSKKQRKFAAIGGGILFLAWALNYLFTPFQLSIPYGVCKTHLELNVSYPKTLYISEANFLADKSVRIWFTQIDPFGEFRMQSFHCFFTQNPETGKTVFSKIKMGKVDIDSATIELYNKALPVLASVPMDLRYPAPLPDVISDLQIDVEAARRIKITDILKP